MSDESAPLDGIRVLDFSRVLSGPYCTMFLADLGADVVKVEHRDKGDDTRAFGPPFVDGVSTYFLSINRGKRSIALDLKLDADRAVALQLAKVADVVVENFRPGVMDRLGLGYSTLSAVNPGVVFCSISGFGQDKPKPGYDLLVQGLSGIPSLTGDAAGPPYKCGASIADLTAGLNASQGILAALVRRQRTGAGARVDVPMIDSHVSLLTYHASAWLNAGEEPGRIGNAHPSIHPFNTYETTDGWLNLCVGNDKLWAAFCRTVEHPEWIEDPRFASNADRVRHREELDALLVPLFRTLPVSTWVERIGAARVPCGPMATVPQALAWVEPVAHPHPDTGEAVRSLPRPFRMDGVARAAARGAPRLGQHTSEVLADWLQQE